VFVRPLEHYCGPFKKNLLLKNFDVLNSINSKRSRSKTMIKETRSLTLPDLATNYEEYVEEFYQYLPKNKEVFINDALYHKKRYLDMLQLPLGNRVLELGSDKPFITHCLRKLYPDSTFHTISIDIPYSPYPIIRVDIESEVFPFEDESIDDVIFTEVLEHLFRDPAWVVFQINRVLRIGGKVFLTTPNACGYDAVQNILLQKNPNERNQFYAKIESGHPHLWTAHEVRMVLEAHGFLIRELGTEDYYDIPLSNEVAEFIKKNSIAPGFHAQALRVIAEKRIQCSSPVYMEGLYPDRQPVQLIGALKKWLKTLTKNKD
jgi:SAM-dependent methyltransferase